MLITFGCFLPQAGKGFTEPKESYPSWMMMMAGSGADRRVCDCHLLRPIRALVPERQTQAILRPSGQLFDQGGLPGGGGVWLSLRGGQDFIIEGGSLHEAWESGSFC